MDDSTILDILSGDGKDLAYFKKNIDIMKDFLLLVNRIDAMPETNRRDESISLYQAVAKDLPPQLIQRYFIAFFGAPVKRAADPVKLKLKFNSSAKYLGGIRTDQTFFLKKTPHGEFYGAIWPWVRKPEFQTIHIGYHSRTLSDEDDKKLEALIRHSTHQRMISDMETGVGGVIHGVSLPAFLQMSEMENTTATLNIKSAYKSGTLHLNNGKLFDGETGGLKGKEAVYEIISWDNVSIQIGGADQTRQNIMNEPLMHILMESLKIKDERMAAATEAETTVTPLEIQEEADRIPDIDDSKIETGDKKLHPREQKTQKKRLLLAYTPFVLALFTLIAGVYVIGKQVKSYGIKKDYQILVENLDKQKTYKNKEILINLFINSHKDSKYADKAREKLVFLRKTMDEQLYKDIITSVEAIPLTIDFEKTDNALFDKSTGPPSYGGKRAKAFYDEKMARALYQKYLSQFPKGRYVEDIKSRISMIPQKIDDAHFEQLISANWEDEDEKIKAFKGYIISHPKGKHRDEVENVLVNLLEKNYVEIRRSISVCDENGQWSPCLKKCNRFLALFDNTYRTDEVRAIKNSLHGKQDLADLSRKVNEKDNDYIAIKTIYHDYLESNPDSTVKDTIQERLHETEILIADKNVWDKLAVYSRDPDMNIDERISALDRYIKQNSEKPYISQAGTLLAQLEAEKLRIDQRELLEKKREQERRQSLLAEKRQEEHNLHLKRETSKIVSRFQSIGGRFQNHGNGTFTDLKTGLMWCVLDSDITLEKCLDYPAASKYVKSLTTGGYRDWRLPTFSELSSIYKSRPFFPSSGNKTFWTSETVVKGYHRMAGVVSSKQETVFQRDYVLTRDCATVHAVRGRN